MSRRRRQNQSDDSLELLLDTITNAFGGIVFLALLIVLIAGQSKSSTNNESSSQKDRAEYEAARQGMTKIVHELETAKQSLAIAKANRADLSSEDFENNLNELAMAQKENTKLLKLQLDIEKSIKKTKEERAKLDELMANDALKVKEKENEVKRKRAELEKEIQQRTVKSDLPKERATRKKQAVLMVKNGEMFVLHADRNVRSLKINENHLTKCSDSDADIILSGRGSWKTMSGRGISLSNENEIRDEISKHDRSRLYAAIVIWEDSFGYFDLIRRTCVDHNLEYRLIPLPKGEKVRESSSSSAPKVQ